ncbi:MAG: hypothetical protein U0K90_03400, partial [Bacteroidales bacterium]|nr:hypothetical protein [Bacteroidales bacterium]
PRIFPLHERSVRYIPRLPWCLQAKEICLMKLSYITNKVNANPSQPSVQTEDIKKKMTNQ